MTTDGTTDPGATTLVPRMFLRANPDVLVARVGLGATFYLDEPVTWGRGPIADAFRAFLDVVPPRWLRWYTKSILPGWQPVSESELSTFVRYLGEPWLERGRHGLRLRVSDDPGVPAVGFDYREVDPQREAAAAVLEITVPQDFDPAAFQRLVQSIGGMGPLWCAVGGFAGRWNERHKSSAFWQLHRWARRYWCLDVQDPPQTSWQVAGGLPGTGWLTLIGGALARARGIPLDRLRQQDWGRTDVACFEVGQGLLVRAGDVPTTGDLNQLQYPSTFAAVNWALSPWFIDPLRPLWGGFYEDQQTTCWQRRFVEPQHWAY